MNAHKVLIVDDSSLARLMLRQIFGQHFPAWQIIEARNGAEALERVRQERPQLALLDYNMPDTNGLDLALELLQLEPDLPIHLVTANIQDVTRQRAEAAGIGFVCKPICRDSLAPLLAGISP